MRRQPIPNAHSAGRQAGLAMQGYAPAQSQAPATAGFGFTEGLDIGDKAYFSRARNVIAGDDVLGFFFVWSGTNIAAPTDIAIEVALYSLEDDRRMLRKITGASITRTLASVTTHGRTELLRVPPKLMDHRRTLVIGIAGTYVAGDWDASGVEIHGQAYQPSAVSFSVDGTVSLYKETSTLDDVVDVQSCGGVAVVPSVGIATSRVRVVGLAGSEVFLF